MVLPVLLHLLRQLAQLLSVLGCQLIKLTECLEAKEEDSGGG